MASADLITPEPKIITCFNQSKRFSHPTFSIYTGLLSAGLCVLWYIFSEDVGWVWILQDFLGVSVCLLFLSSVHLPNLQAATMLLGE